MQRPLLSLVQYKYSQILYTCTVAGLPTIDRFGYIFLFFFQDGVTSICNLSSIFEWMLGVIQQDILDLTYESFKTVKTQVLREKFDNIVFS